MLKLYTDTKFLTEAYRKKVFPLLFDLHFLKNTELLSYYELVDEVEKSDIVVFPIDYSQFIKFREAFKSLLQLAKKHDKPIWIYSGGDYGFTNYIRNSYTFRLGGFKSKLDANTFILPSFVNDPYENYIQNNFSVFKREDKPTIGFVGHAQLGFKKYIKEYISYLKYCLKRIFHLIIADKQVFYPSSIKRAQCLQKLQKSTLLKTNFILRKHYRDNKQKAFDKEKSREDYYNNIINNTYTFCCRGVGNFSVRFYETLALGRIPVLFDTDCKLPLEGKIDWSRHCVIIVEKSRLTLDEQIINFHKALSNVDFEILQVNNRKLWKLYLERPAYFIKLHDLFLATINKNG